MDWQQAIAFIVVAATVVVVCVRWMKRRGAAGSACGCGCCPVAGADRPSAMVYRAQGKGEERGPSAEHKRHAPSDG